MYFYMSLLQRSVCDCNKSIVLYCVNEEGFASRQIASSLLQSTCSGHQ